MVDKLRKTTVLLKFTICITPVLKMQISKRHKRRHFFGFNNYEGAKIFSIKATKPYQDCSSSGFVLRCTELYPAVIGNRNSKELDASNKSAHKEQLKWLKFKQSYSLRYGR